MGVPEPLDPAPDVGNHVEFVVHRQDRVAFLGREIDPEHVGCVLERVPVQFVERLVGVGVVRGDGVLRRPGPPELRNGVRVRDALGQRVLGGRDVDDGAVRVDRDGLCAV